MNSIMDLISALIHYFSITRLFGLFPFEIKSLNEINILKISKKFLTYSWIFFIISNLIFIIQLCGMLYMFTLKTEIPVFQSCLALFHHMLVWLHCGTFSWSSVNNAEIICKMWLEVNRVYFILSQMINKPVNLQPIKILVIIFITFPLISILIATLLQIFSNWNVFVLALTYLPSSLVSGLYITQFLIRSCVIYNFYYTINCLLKDKRKIVIKCFRRNSPLQYLKICDEILKDFSDTMNDIFSHSQLWFIAQTFLALYFVVLHYVIQDDTEFHNRSNIYFCTFYAFYLWLFCSCCAYTKSEVKIIFCLLSLYM